MSGRRQSLAVPLTPSQMYQPASSRGRSGRVENLWYRPSAIRVEGRTSPAAAAAARNSAVPSANASFVACCASNVQCSCVLPHAGGKLCRARATAPSSDRTTLCGWPSLALVPAVSLPGPASRADTTERPPLSGGPRNHLKRCVHAASGPRASTRGDEGHARCGFCALTTAASVPGQSLTGLLALGCADVPGFAALVAPLAA